MKSPIEIENVSKSYGAENVIRNLSCSFLENKIIVIVGRSGSGKSTLLKMINGLVKPDSGRVYVFDREIDYGRLTSMRSRIGYSVQGTSLFPHLTVLENITLLPRLRGWEKEKISLRTEELMKFVNLSPDFRKRYPYELSGGEQQRVGICRAMIMNPEVCLLDEAFGALDPTTRIEIHRELLEIQRNEPRTIILVTHDLPEAFRLADQIVVMEKGEILTKGSPSEIKNSDNEFIKYLLSAQKT